MKKIGSSEVVRAPLYHCIVKEGSKQQKLFLVCLKAPDNDNAVQIQIKIKIFFFSILEIKLILKLTFFHIYANILT